MENLFNYFSYSNNIPDENFIITSDSKLSFNDFIKYSKAFASKLLANNVQRNDNVAILLDHNKDFLIAFCSVLLINANPVLLNFKLKNEEIKKLLNIANCKHLICSESKKSGFNDINCIDFSIDHNLCNNNFSIEDVEKPSVMLFTSGTESSPKVVMHSLSSLRNSIVNSNYILKQNTNDKWLASLPFNHIGGLLIFFRAFFYNTQLIIPNSLSAPDLKEIIEKKEPTLMSLVPTQLSRLNELHYSPGVYIKYLLLGGSATPLKLLKESLNKGWKIIKIYGSSETAALISAIEINKDNIESSGKILPNTIVKIKQDQILIKSNQLFKGYYNEDTLTSRKIKDGYFYTGDTGYIDDSGFLYITGRIDEVFKSGGENINPFEIEKELLKHPKIKYCVVFPVGDNDWINIPAVAIELNDKTNKISKEEIIEFLADKFSTIKIPKKIFIMDSFPMSSTGKILRNEIIKNHHLYE